jgi:hypothetical protein
MEFYSVTNKHGVETFHRVPQSASEAQPATASLKRPEDALELFKGTLELDCFETPFTDADVKAAAKFLIDQGVTQPPRSQAEVLSLAGQHGWSEGFGAQMQGCMISASVAEIRDPQQLDAIAKALGLNTGIEDGASFFTARRSRSSAARRRGRRR